MWAGRVFLEEETWVHLEEYKVDICEGSRMVSERLKADDEES